MYNRRYDKVFMLLSQELGGYSIGSRKAEGNALVEIRNGKGKLTVYVQGLRRPGQGAYRIYLIAVHSGEAVGFPATLLAVDAKGQGTVKWEFDPENVGGCGMTIDAFSAIAVMEHQELLHGRVVAPLCGYKDGRIDWRGIFREWKEDKAEAEEKNDMRKPVPGSVEETAEESATERAGQTAEEGTPERVEQAAEKDVWERAGQIAEEGMPERAGQTAEEDVPERAGQTAEDGIPESAGREEEAVLLAAEASATEAGYADKEDFYGEFQMASETAVLPAEESDPHGTFKQIAVKFQKELQELEESGILSMEEIKRVRDIVLEENAKRKQKREAELAEQERQRKASGGGSKADAEPAECSNGASVKQTACGSGGSKADAEPAECGGASVKQTVCGSRGSKADVEPAECGNGASVKQTVCGSGGSKADVEPAECGNGANSQKHKKAADPFEREEMQAEPENKTKGNGCMEVEESMAVDPMGLFLENDLIEPFTCDTDWQWVRINIKELAALSVDCQRIWNAPFAVFCYYTYKHMIFGRPGNAGRVGYLLGLPDVFYSEDQMQAKALGFRHFRCLDNEQPKNGSYGYWMMPIGGEEKA